MNKGAQKIGHVTGLIAYGLVTTLATAAASVVESTVRGLAQTGRTLASEIRPAPRQAAPAPPAEQEKASEAPRRRKRKRSRKRDSVQGGLPPSPN